MSNGERPTIPSVNAAESPKLNFGVKVISMTVAINFLAMAFMYSYGVMLKPIADTFSLSRSQASIAPMVFLLTASLSAPFIGALLDRWRIRNIMLGFSCFAGIGLMSLVFAESYWQYLLIVGLILGVSMQGMGMLSATKLLTNWFQESRGLAMGFSAIGLSLSATIMPPLCAWLLAEHTWKTSYFYFGCATLLIAPILILKYVHNRPEDVGLTVDFNRASPAPDTRRGDGLSPVSPAIVSVPIFWKIIVIVGFPAGILVAINTHVIAFLTDKGISQVDAASVMAVVGGLAMVGKACWGYIFDRFNIRSALAIAMGLQLLGVYLLMSGSNYLSFVAAAIVYGFGMGSVPTSHGFLIARSFGQAHFGKAMGLSVPVMLPLTMGAVYLAGFLFDRLHSYEATFQLFILFFVVSFVFVLRIKQSDRSGSASPDPVEAIESQLA